MGLKPPNFAFLFIIIALASHLHEDANGATYTDISIANYVRARLYVPNSYANNYRDNLTYPLVVYYHGGGFAIGSYSDLRFNNFVEDLVDHSKVIALSVDYRLNNASAAYDDSYTALEYVASHYNGSGPSPKLNTMVDFEKIFLSGDSAGGNIAHNMAMKIASNEITGLRIKGIALLCPYFWGLFPLPGEPLDPYCRASENKLWIAAAKTLNLDDPRINPLVDPKLATIGTSKILVITAFGDPLYYRGLEYAKQLQINRYNGQVEYHEYKGVHDFFILFPHGPEYSGVLDQVSSFFNSA